MKPNKDAASISTFFQTCEVKVKVDLNGAAPILPGHVTLNMGGGGSEVEGRGHEAELFGRHPEFGIDDGTPDALGVFGFIYISI